MHDEPIRFAVAAELGGTTQVARDAEAHVIAPFYVPRNHYQRLDLFRKAYEEIALVNQGIEALVLLCNSNLVGASGDGDVDRETLGILERINYHDVSERSYRQEFVYGFSAEEYVLSADFRELLKIHVIDSRTLFIRKNPQGDILDALQIPPLPLLEVSRDKMIPFAIRLPVERIQYSSRAQLGDSIYGMSLIQPLIQSGLPRTLQVIEQSKGIIYRKTAGNAQHFNCDFTKGQNRVNQAEARKIAGDVAATIAKRAEDQDVFTVGPVSNEPLFKSSGINFTEDQRFVVEQMLAGMGLVPELLGYSFGQAQSQAREKLAILVDRIQRIRKQREYLINTRLMPLIQRVYGMSVTPKVRWENPTVIDAKLAAEEMSIWITVVQQYLRMGFVSPEQAAEMLDLPGVYDRDKVMKWIEQNNMEQDAPTNEARNAKNNQISEERAVVE